MWSYSTILGSECESHTQTTGHASCLEYHSFCLTDDEDTEVQSDISLLLFLLNNVSWSELMLMHSIAMLMMVMGLDHHYYRYHHEFLLSMILISREKKRGKETRFDSDPNDNISHPNIERLKCHDKRHWMKDWEKETVANPGTVACNFLSRWDGFSSPLTFPLDLDSDW